jgi:small conductance mechanosensitive channel
MDIETARHLLLDQGIPIAMKIVGAIVLWMVGRLVINGLRRLIRATGSARRVDPTLLRYFESATHVLLSVLLLIAVLSVFGIETTSFAGVIAATGVAIGMAWSGLLSNFAAGVFILALRPFRVGDLIAVAGVSGIVREIGMFSTGIDTADNVRTWIGNTRVFGDNIQNFTTNGSRRVEVKVPLPAGIDVLEAMARLVERAARVPDAAKEPSPSAELTALDGHGVVALRVHAPAELYGRVTSELNRAALAWVREQAPRTS